MPYRPEEGWPVGTVVGKLGVGRLGFEDGIVGNVGLVVGIDGLVGRVGFLPGSTVTFTVTVGMPCGAVGFVVGSDGLPGRLGSVGF